MTAPAAAPARVRVIRLLRVREGMDEEFVRSYGDVRAEAELFPGHLGEQLCCSLDDPAQWLLTSEWADAEAIRRWRTDSAHRVLVEPMNACLHDDRWTGVFHIRESTERD
ncbi:antibiotic biosynthesis monooxygenase [Streptomyces sp. NBC_00287]|uniref:antibiotic biosynthesis monooxygenase family protein n=1 Tax=Streptomyces sp. NBC_00287 TaxID=2975702 RepID=UPI002E2D92E9|nr:antibiotic biosynthesis monooxygenase family protein [Streptomyces sp. NBC_00287]